MVNNCLIKLFLMKKLPFICTQKTQLLLGQLNKILGKFFNEGSPKLINSVNSKIKKQK